MQPISLPSLLISRSMVRPRPSTQKRRLFSRSALGITGMHDSTVMSVSSRITSELTRRPESEHPSPHEAIVFAFCFDCARCSQNFLVNFELKCYFVLEVMWNLG